MDLALLFLAVVGVSTLGFYPLNTKGGVDKSNSQQSQELPIPHALGVDNDIGLWNEGWEITKDTGAVKIVLGQKLPECGLVVALSNKWMDKTAGGLAIVINSCPNASTYFADLPHLNGPRASSANVHNFTVKPHDILWIKWTPSEVLFGDDIGRVLLRTAGFGSGYLPGRYLAFGSIGGDASCTPCSDHSGYINSVKFI